MQIKNWLFVYIDEWETELKSEREKERDRERYIKARKMVKRVVGILNCEDETKWERVWIRERECVWMVWSEKEKERNEC
jgi:hypothetical protein